MAGPDSCPGSKRLPESMPRRCKDLVSRLCGRQFVCHDAAAVADIEARSCQCGWRPGPLLKELGLRVDLERFGSQRCQRELAVFLKDEIVSISIHQGAAAERTLLPGKFSRCQIECAK